MTTTTETNNFKEVTISTVTLPNGVIESVIFFNGCEVWQTNKVQSIEKQHKIAVNVAMKYNLYYGIEKGYSEPILAL